MQYKQSTGFGDCLKLKYICLPFLTNGALAQLARALRWQRRGHRFESDMLHTQTPAPGCFFCRSHREKFFSQIKNRHLPVIIPDSPITVIHK